MKVRGNRFIGNANNCFDADLNKEENLIMAKCYWNNGPSPNGDTPIWETLVDGDIEIVEIVEEVNQNI